MPKKNIVLCSDGTGGTVMKNRGTNVWKLYEAVDVNSHRYQVDPKKSTIDPAPKQIAFYDDGVGTEEFMPLKMLGGSGGWGLGRNVRNLYMELCRNYEPGDNIYLFGFSRGAYTVRILASLIAKCGIINNFAVMPEKAADSNDEYDIFFGYDDEALSERVDKAYELFRKYHFRYFGKKPDSSGKAMTALKDWLTMKDQGLSLRYYKDWLKSDKNDPPPLLHEDVRIKFLGVWDTVSAIGMPFPGLTDFWNFTIFPYKFTDATLDPKIDYACHALSIDDERMTFHPEVWDEREEEKPDRIDQVWFAGVHSNVGGGYPKQGMAQVSLIWMINKAKDYGLRFTESMCQNYCDLQDVHDKLHDSRSGVAAYYYRYKPRNIADICIRNGVIPKIHVSAIERVFYCTLGYAPGNLPNAFVCVEPKFFANDTYYIERQRYDLAFRMRNTKKTASGRLLTDKEYERVAHSEDCQKFANNNNLSQEEKKFFYGEPKSELLDKVSGWVRCRQVAQFLFYLTTTACIVVLVLAVAVHLSSKFTFFQDQNEAFILLFCLALLLAFLYYVGRVAQNRMQKEFSKLRRKFPEDQANRPRIGQDGRVGVESELLPDFPEMK